MEILLKELDKYKNIIKIDNKNIYPFNNISESFLYLLTNNFITIEEYKKIKSDYINRNKYLYLFEMTSPRKFGEKWAQNHLLNNINKFKVPNNTIDFNYKNQYDLIYKNIKIEVKASRAVDKNSNKMLVEKALSTTSNKKFVMNFQQLKPNCCDIFILIGVWTDKIKYWIINSKEIKNNQYYSNKQHRNSVNEGQMWIKNDNINYFNKYLINNISDIVERIEKINNDNN